MHGCVHDVEVFLSEDDILVYHGLVNSLHVFIVHLTTDDFYQFVYGCELHVLNLNLVHLIYDTCVVRHEHLCTVFPVSLISVVFFGIVAGCYVNSCLCAQMTYGKGNFWCGAQALEEIHLYAVGTKDGSYSLGKETSVVAAIVSHYNTQLLTLGEGLNQIVGKSLCGHAHDVLVHSVGSCSHDAAQSTCAEFQILVKGVHQICLVLILHHLADFRFCLFVVVR